MRTASMMQSSIFGAHVCDVIRLQLAAARSCLVLPLVDLYCTLLYYTASFISPL